MSDLPHLTRSSPILMTLVCIGIFHHVWTILKNAGALRCGSEVASDIRMSD